MTSGGQFLARQRPKAPARLVSEAKGSPRLSHRVQRYRVTNGAELVGQWSNLDLVEDSLLNRPDAIVTDMATIPPKVIYKDGQWLHKDWIH